MSFDQLLIGHVTDVEHGTGVSVFILPPLSRGGVFMAGSAPATREISVLEPSTKVNQVDGLVFSGGSAFGLASADGVMQWLQEQGRGYNTIHGAVPIVPAASIYDLGVKSNIPPTAMDGYQACKVAQPNNTQQGKIGAGAGASVGKLFLSESQAMTGGFGFAELVNPNGAIVRAYAVVNSVGDIIDATGNIIAGAIKGDKFFHIAKALLEGKSSQLEANVLQQNTTLVAVVTNSFFAKPALTRLAKMASAGMGRAMQPCFTAYDGDMIFCLSIGDLEADEIQIGMMCNEATRLAIVNAVAKSTPV
jgi:L-aminopeptidase/D-esterase-like protein